MTDEEIFRQINLLDLSGRGAEARQRRLDGLRSELATRREALRGAAALEALRGPSLVVDQLRASAEARLRAAEAELAELEDNRPDDAMSALLALPLTRADLAYCTRQGIDPTELPPRKRVRGMRGNLVHHVDGSWTHLLTGEAEAPEEPRRAQEQPRWINH